MLRTLLTLVICSIVTAAAAANDPDSLKAELRKTTQSLEDKISICLEIVEQYIYAQQDSAKRYNEMADNLAEDLLNAETVSDTVVTRFSANIQNNYGRIAYVRGDMVSALKYQFISKSLWEELKDTVEMGIAYNNIAVIYKNAGDFDKAQINFEKAAKVLEKTSATTKFAMVMNNTANLLLEIGEFDLALDHAIIARDLRKGTEDINGYAATLNNMGKIYFKLDQLDSAEMILMEGLAVIDGTNNLRGISSIKANLAEVYFAQGFLEKGLAYGESALTMAKELHSEKSVMDAAMILEPMYVKLERWKDAYDMQTLIDEGEEQIQLEKLNRDLIRKELDFVYQRERLADKAETDKQLAIAKERDSKFRITLTFTIFILVLVIIFLIILYRRNRELKLRNEHIEEQNKERTILLQEVHHRVKNNFQVISSLLKLQAGKITNKEAKASLTDAINRVYAMSSVHEIMYKNERFSNLDNEKYLSELVSKLKHSFDADNVTSSVDVADELTTLKMTIPLGIIVNELVTNTFKHAFPKGFNNAKLCIDIKRENKDYSLTYKDNGIGIVTTEGKETFGAILIDAMVDQLSGEITYTSEPDWATVITISFSE